MLKSLEAQGFLRKNVKASITQRMIRTKRSNPFLVKEKKMLR